MATYKAIAAGNWDNLAIWQDNSTGPFIASTVLPSSADTVYFNTFLVQANIDIIVDKLLSTTSSGISVGGGIVVTTNRNITASTEIRTSTGVTDLIDISGTGLTITITSLNIYAASLNCIELATTNSTLNINGNITGSPNSNTGYGLNITGATNNINIIGNQFTGGNTNGFAIRVGSAGNTISIVGNQLSSTTGNCISVTTSNNLTIVGNQTATSTGIALSFTSGTHIVNITGTQTGSNINVTGRAIVGVYLTTFLNITGNAYAGTAGAAVAQGTITYRGGIYNLSDKTAIFTENMILSNTVDTFWTFKEAVGATMVTLAHTDSIPLPADVRQGTVYTGGNTGSLIIPSPSNVRKGVPTDATIGTADLTAQDFLDLLSTSPDPIAERLRNVSTVQTTGDQITSLS